MTRWKKLLRIYWQFCVRNALKNIIKIISEVYYYDAISCDRRFGKGDSQQIRACKTVTAKRARQLLEISENNKIPLTDKPVKLAINDIATGKVTCRAADDISEESEETTSDSDNTEE